MNKLHNTLRAFTTIYNKILNVQGLGFPYTCKNGIHTISCYRAARYISWWYEDFDILSWAVFLCEQGLGNALRLFFASCPYLSRLHYVMAPLPNGGCLSRIAYTTQRAKFMGSTWGPPGSCRPQIGPMSASWTLLSGNAYMLSPLFTVGPHALC